MFILAKRGKNSRLELIRTEKHNGASCCLLKLKSAYEMVAVSSEVLPMENNELIH